MSALVLEALEPAALEVSLEVAADVEAQRQRLHQHWAKRLERAGYEVDRAARQYHAVDPLCGAQSYVAMRSENRFVTNIQPCGRHITFSAYSAELTQNRVRTCQLWSFGQQIAA